MTFICKEHKFSIIYSSSVHGTGHYTQVVWAETNQVGCGYVYFKTMVKGGWWYKTLIVCNFWPAGNVRGQAMYEVGKPCAFCGGEKDNKEKCEDGLCLV